MVEGGQLAKQGGLSPISGLARSVLACMVRSSEFHLSWIAETKALLDLDYPSLRGEKRTVLLRWQTDDVDAKNRPISNAASPGGY